MRPGKKTALIVSILMLAASGPAGAHRPVFASAFPGLGSRIPFSIGPHTSLAVYGHLRSPGQVDEYLVAIQAGTILRMRMIVPKLLSLWDFRPSFALLGPGLPAPPPGLPIPAPAGEGALICAATDQAQTHLELLTQTSYWLRQAAALEVPGKGAFHLLVWSPDRRIGQYVLSLGTEKDERLTDPASLPSAWIGVHRWLGLRQAIWPLGLLVFLIMGIVLAGKIAKDSRRQAR